jgi:hypothetical protein
MQIVWIIKDSYIGNSFFDAAASNFIMPSLFERINGQTDKVANNILKNCSDSKCSKIYYLKSSDPSSWNSSSCVDLGSDNSSGLTSTSNLEGLYLHNTLLKNGASVGPGWLQRVNFCAGMASDCLSHKIVKKEDLKAPLQVSYSSALFFIALFYF